MSFIWWAGELRSSSPSGSSFQGVSPKVIYFPLMKRVSKKLQEQLESMDRISDPFIAGNESGAAMNVGGALS
jgi:hypothetical protein